jgi:hypothetical protein
MKPSESQLDTLLHIWVEGGATDALLAPSPKGQAPSAWDEWTFAMERMYSRTATDVCPLEIPLPSCKARKRILTSSHPNMSSKHSKMVPFPKSIPSDH